MKATSVAPEEQNGVPVRYPKSVDQFILEGVQQQFLKLFNMPSVWTTSTDKIKALEKIFPDKQQPDFKITYPYAFLILGAWQKSPDRGNRRASSLRGTRVDVSTDVKSSTNVRTLPVDMTVSVEMYFNRYLDMTDTGRRWMFMQERGSLNFQIAYGQSSFDISVIPEDNITFPQREADPDNVQEYVMTTSMVIRGHISETEPIQVPVIDQVVVEGSTNADPSTVIWSFKSPKPIGD